MANKNFIVKNGLEVGGQEVVSSSGVVTSAALGGQTLSTTDSPIFADLTLTGNLNLTGDINSYNVTDLDVTDQTITLGAGQLEALSGGSGIIVDGSNASILWDETNDVFDFNKGLTTLGNVGIGTTSPQTDLNIVNTSGATLDINTNLAGADSKILLHEGSSSSPANGASIRYDGANNLFKIGVGSSVDTTRLTIARDSGNVGIGTDGPSEALSVSGNVEIIRTAPHLDLMEDGVTDSNHRFRQNAGNLYIQKLSDDKGTSTDRIVLDGGTGNVGIDTTSPDGKLDVAQAMTNGSTGTFTSPHLALTATNTTDTTGFVGMTIATSDNANYGFSYGALRSSGGLGDLIWKNHYNSADGTELLRLTYNGKVGIGTNNPPSPLSIFGAGVSSPTASTAQESYDNALFRINNFSNSSVGLSIGSTGSNVTHIQTSYNEGTTSPLTLNPFGGNVGIGTTNPSQSLEVVDSDNYQGVHIRGSNAPCLTFAQGVSTTPTWRAGISGLDGSAFAISTGASVGDVLHIKNNGRVGIGTTSPAYPLHVNGTLHVGVSGTTAGDVTGTLNIGNTGTYYMTQIKAINVTANPSILRTRMGFFTLSGTGETVSDSTEKMSILADSGNVGIGTISPGSKLTVNGSFSKSSGSFRIDHPLEAKSTTHDLVHSFVEAPQADNIYRGKVDLVNGSATVNIDTVAGMTEGTFVALNREVQCFTTNESNWDAVKGSVLGNSLTIESENSESTATISWLVIGERQDSHMYDTEWTDDNGKVIVEPTK